MVIYGIERGFRLTVGAYREIAEMMPNGNIEELRDVLGSDDPFMTMGTIFRLAVIMNKWDEKQKKFSDPEYIENRPLSVEELETLPMTDVVGDLKDEIVDAIIASQNTELTLKKTNEASDS